MRLVELPTYVFLAYLTTFAYSSVVLYAYVEVYRSLVSFFRFLVVFINKEMR